MAEPFLAEIRIFAIDFPPRGWADCDGEILPIAQNLSLHNLLGTTFGGDGRTTFALPDLRGRVPIGVSVDYSHGQRGGEERHTLLPAEIPSHTHTLQASNQPANRESLGNSVWSASSRNGYSSATPNGSLASGSVQAVGGQSHENMQPFLTLRFVIAIQGAFPPRD